MCGSVVGMTCSMLSFVTGEYCPPDDWWMRLLLRYVGRGGAGVCHEKRIRGSYGCIGRSTVDHCDVWLH